MYWEVGDSKKEEMQNIIIVKSSTVVYQRHVKLSKAVYVHVYSLCTILYVRNNRSTVMFAYTVLDKYHLSLPLSLRSGVNFIIQSFHAVT